MTQPSEVRLYALNTCSHCKTVEKLLQEHAVPYTRVSVDDYDPPRQMEIVAAIKLQNPRLAFPMLVCGERVVIGDNESEIRAVLAAEGWIHLPPAGWLKRLLGRDFG